jgi:hypothetical protein
MEFSVNENFQARKYLFAISLIIGLNFVYVETRNFPKSQRRNFLSRGFNAGIMKRNCLMQINLEKHVDNRAFRVHLRHFRENEK